MNREYHRWYSHRLGRDMELLIFGHAGAKVLVFPTRDGRYHEYEDLRLTEALRHKIDAGQLQLYCVDSIVGESLYCDWCHPADRIRRHSAFEDYVLNEVLPLMALKNPHPCTIAHGCSLGAFHAVNIALRHPHLFRKIVAFSGRYDLTLEIDSFRDLFNGHREELTYFHSPAQFLVNLSCPERLAAMRSMDITLVVGNEDPFLIHNRWFSEVLWAKGIWHALHVWHGRAHRGHDWRRMAPLYV